MNTNPRSLSRKIQKMLIICRKINKKEDHLEIIKHIKSKSTGSPEIQEFIYHSNKRKVIISDRAIRRIINYCASFNLLEKQVCVLTTDGNLAIQSDDSFREVLKGSIKKYLKRKHNYDLKDIGVQIKSVPDSDSSCGIPLPEQIWSLINKDIIEINKSRPKEDQAKKIPLKSFKTILNLLVDCGYLNVYRKKIYTFPESSQDRMIGDILELT